MEHPENLTGHFIIAETELQDPNFVESVVLIIEHNDEGAFGLVVNRALGLSIGEVIEDASESPAKELPVHLGGPVQQDHVFILHHDLPELTKSEFSKSACPEVTFEPDGKRVLDFLDQVSENHRNELFDRIRFYGGYAGWGSGQIELELNENSWIIIPAQKALIFSNDIESVWKDALRKKGGIYWVAAETGFKPSLN
jgi:putative transcriptional regulator